MRIFLLFAGVLAVTFLSCKSDKLEPADPDCPEIISFADKVQPIIMNNCAVSGCHAPGFTSPTLTTHFQISENAENILIRIQLDPTDSQLMPSGGPKLADSLIQQIKCWVNQGKQDN